MLVKVVKVSTRLRKTNFSIPRRDSVLPSTANVPQWMASSSRNCWNCLEVPFLTISECIQTTVMWKAERPMIEKGNSHYALLKKAPKIPEPVFKDVCLTLLSRSWSERLEYSLPSKLYSYLIHDVFVVAFSQIYQTFALFRSMKTPRLFWVLQSLLVQR